MGPIRYKSKFMRHFKMKRNPRNASNEIRSETRVKIWSNIDNFGKYHVKSDIKLSIVELTTEEENITFNDAEDQLFNLHKERLCFHSIYFRKLLLQYNDTAVSELTISIPSGTFYAFTVMIKYFYNGFIMLPVPDVIELFPKIVLLKEYFQVETLDLDSLVQSSNPNFIRDYYYQFISTCAKSRCMVFARYLLYNMSPVREFLRGDESSNYEASFDLFWSAIDEEGFCEDVIAGIIYLLSLVDPSEETKQLILTVISSTASYCWRSIPEIMQLHPRYFLSLMLKISLVGDISETCFCDIILSYFKNNHLSSKDIDALLDLVDLKVLPFDYIQLYLFPYLQNEKVCEIKRYFEMLKERQYSSVDFICPVTKCFMRSNCFLICENGHHSSVIFNRSHTCYHACCRATPLQEPFEDSDFLQQALNYLQRKTEKNKNGYDYLMSLVSDSTSLFDDTQRSFQTSSVRIASVQPVSDIEICRSVHVIYYDLIIFIDQIIVNCEGDISACAIKDLWCLKNGFDPEAILVKSPEGRLLNDDDIVLYDNTSIYLSKILHFELTWSTGV